jgi:hypothetical protein
MWTWTWQMYVQTPSPATTTPLKIRGFASKPRESLSRSQYSNNCSPKTDEPILFVCVLADLVLDLFNQHPVSHFLPAAFKSTRSSEISRTSSSSHDPCTRNAPFAPAQLVWVGALVDRPHMKQGDVRRHFAHDSRANSSRWNHPIIDTSLPRSAGIFCDCFVFFQYSLHFIRCGSKSSRNSRRRDMGPLAISTEAH